MYTTINKATPSKTTPDDAILMDVIEQIPLILSEVMTVMFNKMIKTKKFPNSLKTARVLLLPKKKKCKLSYVDTEPNGKTAGENKAGAIKKLF